MRSDTLIYIYSQKMTEKMKHEAVLKLTKPSGFSLNPGSPYTQ